MVRLLLTTRIERPPLFHLLPEGELDWSPTARVERGPSQGARSGSTGPMWVSFHPFPCSASKKGTWPLPSQPSETARCTSTGNHLACPLLPLPSVLVICLGMRADRSSTASTLSLPRQTLRLGAPYPGQTHLSAADPCFMPQVSRGRRENPVGGLFQHPAQ